MPLQTWGQLVDDAPESAGGFEPLPDGDYEIIITKAEVTKNSADKVGYNITGKVEQGAQKNRTFFYTFWVSPESPTAMGIFFRQFGVLGLDRVNYFKALEPSDEKVAKDLVNKRFYATLGKRVVGEKTYTDIKNMKPPISAAPLGGPTPTASAPTPTATAPAAPTAAPTAPTAPPAAPAPAANDAWGSLGTPAAPSAPATPVAPPLPPLGPGSSPF